VVDNRDILEKLAMDDDLAKKRVQEYSEYFEEERRRR
jgi:hypothetical protein